MKSNGTSKGSVQIASESLAANWMVARSYQVGQPLAGIVRKSRPESVFVENELMVDGDDHDTLSFLVDEYHAEVLSFPELPPQPEGMDPQRARSIAEMPLPVTVRLPAEGFDLDILEEVAEGEPEGELHITSRAGAGTLALARRLLREGRRVMPNMVGGAAILPLSTAAEGTPPKPVNDPYTWSEFNGPARITRAWQLVQAYEQASSLKAPVFLGIFDAGFALDPNGRPTVINSRTPDVTNFVQWNLFYESLASWPGMQSAFEKMGESRFAGGQNNEAGKEWHGNAVLSAAAAPINNKTGAAGSGGLTLASGTQLVVPVLFKMFRSAKETIRGLQLCVAWGVDIINMSWSITYPSAIAYRLDPGFPTSLWERTFEWVANQGVVMFAAAGNDHDELPDEVVLPATRTPGVITVGATNANPNDNRVWPSSNYGSSVDIWAPGNNIHTMPDPNSVNGGFASGTSLASPLTAGVAALMLAVNPGLRGEDIKRIMRETAYTDSPDAVVTHALNAQSAVLRAMSDRLPAAPGEEPNNTPQSARPLVAVSPGVLAPQGNTFLSDRFDEDWFFFNTNNYTVLDVSVNYVPELSSVSVTLVPDDPDSRAGVDEGITRNAGQVRIHVEPLAPGIYRLRIRGSGPNMYILNVTMAPRPLAPDIFEDNNTQATAARFRMKRPTAFGEVVEAGGFFMGYYAGHYDANLHLAGDIDYYHIDKIATLGLVKTLFEVNLTDAPLDVAVLDRNGMELEPTLKSVRSAQVRLSGPECWVRVSGATANRYHFRLYDVLDKDKIPGPLQKVDINPIPYSLPYPPDGLIDWEQFYQVEVTSELIEIGKLRLIGDAGLTLDLLETNGEALASARLAEAGEIKVLDIDLAGISPGTYVARIGRDASPAERFNAGSSQKIARFQIGPGW